MENINLEQKRSHPRQLSSVATKESIRKIVNESNSKIKKEFIEEKRRRILLQSHIKAIQDKMESPQLTSNDIELQESIRLLESQIKEKEAEINEKSEELISIKAECDKYHKSMKKHISLKLLRKQIQECNSSIQQLKQEIDEDVNGNQEVKEIQLRSITLVQIKNSEIDNLTKKRRSIAEEAEKFFLSTDSRAFASYEAVKLLLNDQKTLVEQLELMNTRYKKLEQLVYHLSNGREPSELAELSNRAMRKALRKKYLTS